RRCPTERDDLPAEPEALRRCDTASTARRPWAAFPGHWSRRPWAGADRLRGATRRCPTERDDLPAEPEALRRCRHSLDREAAVGGRPRPLVAGLARPVSLPREVTHRMVSPLFAGLELGRARSSCEEREYRAVEAAISFCRGSRRRL